MLSDYFRKLGQGVGRNIRQANWLRQAVAGSDEEKIDADHAVGRDLARAVMANKAVDGDPHRAAWLNHVGARLVACLANKRRRFTFTLLDSGDPNAFALPGGFIFVERTLVELCGRDDDEIAFVLGHEMAHVVKWHALDRVLEKEVLSMLLRPGVAGALVRQFGLPLLTSAHSRDDEFEADVFGTRLAAAADFVPGAGPRLLDRLRPLGASSDQPALAAYFASHPPIPERVARLRRVIGS